MNESPDILYRNSHRNVEHVSMEFQRELLHSINWKARIIGIKGPKGVGKSTLLKQRIKEVGSRNRRIYRIVYHACSVA